MPSILSHILYDLLMNVSSGRSGMALSETSLSKLDVMVGIFLRIGALEPPFYPSGIP